jgi:YidC/Oxa1 family membrane protein insertase
MAADNIGWAGTYSQYFTNIVTAVNGGANKVWSERFPVDLSSHAAGAEWLKKNPGVTPTWYAIEGALGMPGFELKPGAVTSQQFRIYMGPRQYQLLKQLDGGESDILQFGMFGFVSKILLSVMNHIKPFVGSYAVAIIVLTLVIKGLLWPMQNKATQSMKKMQALAPKMNEIKEKYKDDPTRMNQETMKLYKDYGINPVSGCLPMFIQLPVFFGFYKMLGTAIELRNSKFFWVQDLSQPDTVFHLAGIPVNILPLCMAATNVWMMAVSPKSGDNAQQRMMMFMPLIFLFICYNYASGLALYMMVGNLFSVAQLYLTRNQTAPTLQKVAVAKKKR